VSLKTKSFAKPCFTALFKNKQIPLSPPVEIQNEANPSKSYDLGGFFHLRYIKLFIKSQNLGVF
jgi:hypothetical protein